MSRFARRVGAGLKAFWAVPGSTTPKGTYPAICALACTSLGQALAAGRPLNIVDLTMAVLSGLLVASSFVKAFIAAGPAAD